MSVIGAGGVSGLFEEKLRVPRGSSLQYADMHAFSDFIISYKPVHSEMPDFLSEIESDVTELTWLNSQLVRKLKRAEEYFVTALKALNSVGGKSSRSEVMATVQSFLRNAKSRSLPEEKSSREPVPKTVFSTPPPQIFLKSMLAQKVLEERLMREGEDLLQKLLSETNECERLLREYLSVCDQTKDNSKCINNNDMIRNYVDSNPYSSLLANAKEILPPGFVYKTP